MHYFKRLVTILGEIPEYASIVSKSYGDRRIRWIIDIAWSLVCYGALPVDYVRFEFHKKSGRERNRYLTYYRYTPLYKKLERSLKELGLTKCKSKEYDFFSSVIKRNWMYLDLNTPQEQIIDFIKKNNLVIAKPDNGEQGHGVMKIASDDNNLIKKLLVECKTTPYVVEECLHNCEEIAAINSSSLNTIRCYTFIDRYGKPHIMEIMLRVGLAGSHVDNWGSGGIGYCFDVETGICSQYGIDKLNHPYSLHPGSNFQMIGFKLPNFNELKEYILELVKLAPSARYVGWDIAITPNGYDLVEMNCPGGHDFLQAFGRPWGDFMKKNW